MAFALLAGHSLKVAHVCRVDGVANDAQVVDLGDLFSTLESTSKVRNIVETSTLGTKMIQSILGFLKEVLRFLRVYPQLHFLRAIQYNSKK